MKKKIKNPAFIINEAKTMLDAIRSMKRDGDS